MRNEWTDEERRAIEAEYAASLDPVELEKEYAQLMIGEQIPFEKVLREIEEHHRRLQGNQHP